MSCILLLFSYSCRRINLRLLLSALSITRRETSPDSSPLTSKTINKEDSLRRVWRYHVEDPTVLWSDQGSTYLIFLVNPLNLYYTFNVFHCRETHRCLYLVDEDRGTRLPSETTSWTRSQIKTTPTPRLLLHKERKEERVFVSFSMHLFCLQIQKRSRPKENKGR